MAGDDPGASTIAVILDAIQRAWGAVTGSLKAVMSGVVDVVKTSMFFRWRKQMMQANGGSKLKHGYQSLKNLRRHEDHGAVLKSVEIGAKDDAKLFKQELKRARIDFALTHDGEGTYTLHYKQANDKDVLQAQYNILEQRYGSQAHDDQTQNPNHDQRENETREEATPHDNREQDDSEREQQEQREREEQDRSEKEPVIPLPLGDQKEPRDDEAAATPADQEPDVQEQARQEQEQQERLADEQTTPARTETTERTTPHANQAPSVSDPVRAEANSPKRETNRTAISHEPLSELKKQAQARARAKNLARAQSKGLSHARHAHRVKARDFEPAH